MKIKIDSEDKLQINGRYISTENVKLLIDRYYKDEFEAIEFKAKAQLHEMLDFMQNDYTIEKEYERLVINKQFDLSKADISTMQCFTPCPRSRTKTSNPIKVPPHFCDNCLSFDCECYSLKRK